MKIEEQEKRMMEKHETRKIQLENTRDLELLAKKQQEEAAEELQLQAEEGTRKKLVKKMITDSDPALSPITKVLVNVDGKMQRIYISDNFIH